MSGGTGSGKTTLLNALIELLPDDERIVAIEDTLELRINSPNCVRFEARGLHKGAVTIRDLVQARRDHSPAYYSPPLRQQRLHSYPNGSGATDHARTR